MARGSSLNPRFLNSSKTLHLRRDSAFHAGGFDRFSPRFDPALTAPGASSLRVSQENPHQPSKGGYPETLGRARVPDAW